MLINVILMILPKLLCNNKHRYNSVIGNIKRNEAPSKGCAFCVDVFVSMMTTLSHAVL